MNEQTRAYGLLLVAVLLVVGGTLAAGLLPDTLLGQTLAGGLIVLGFALAYLCVSIFDIWE